MSGAEAAEAPAEAAEAPADAAEAPADAAVDAVDPLDKRATNSIMCNFALAYFRATKDW